MKFNWLIIGLAMSASTALAVVPMRMSGADWRVALANGKIANGKASLLSWRGKGSNGSNALRIELLGRTLSPFKHPKTGDTIWAIAPIPYIQSPVSTKISLSRGKEVPAIELPVEIIAGKYRREKINVAKSKVVLSDADKRRVEVESAEIDAIYSAPPRERIWERPFVLPVNSKVTSPFGTQRIFNGALQSFHNGLDLRAWTGTAIKVANSGVVVLAKELFYAGNCVVVDHGSGLFTSYAHLSAVNVKVGDRVMQRQVIGKSGSTGRSSAPHLHWSAKVANVNIDPSVLIELSQRIVANQSSL